MQFCLRLQPPEIATAEALIAASRRAEGMGFGTIWSSEAGHDPFFSLPIVAANTKKIALGSAIAVAYARSPFSTAQVAWDLQRLSQGRFRLGLATQVKAHIERRYSMTWPGGVEALEEYVNCCKAVWHTFQTGEKPDFHSDHYRFTLMNPEFNPGPLPEAHADVPVWLGAVGPVAGRVAGRVAHGLHVHAFHTDGYLREVLLPAMREGRRQANSTRPIEATCSVFAGIAHDDKQARVIRDRMREFIAFYASTPAYLPVLQHAGCEAIHAPLRAMTRAGQWDQMPALVDDTILDKFLVVDAPRRLGERLAAKYGGLLTEVALYRDGGQFASERDWQELLEGLDASAPISPIPA